MKGCGPGARERARGASKIGTTGRGIVASVLVGMVASVTIILLSPSMWERYGLPAANAPIPLDNPAIISIPLSFLALVLVSMGTQSTLKPAADLRSS